MKQIVNQSNGSILADNIRVAGTFWGRLKGLMFKQCLTKGECLIIRPCNMIHTFGMRFALDVVFVAERGDAEYEVVHITENIKPYRIGNLVPKADCVLELPAGTVKISVTKVGDRLQFAPD